MQLTSSRAMIVSSRLPCPLPCKMATLVLTFLTLVVSSDTGNCETAPANNSTPNIVFILADDLGYGELGCQGQKKIRTPEIDRMAREGSGSRNSMPGAPVCAPSRCVLMTGLHAGHAYIRTNLPARWREMKANPKLRRKLKRIDQGQEPIPAEEVTVAELLKTRGYATAAIGKWGLGHSGNTGDPNRQGFDLFFGYLCQGHAHNHYPRYLWRNNQKVPLEGNTRGTTGRRHSHDEMTREALGFIRRNADRPFFLYLPYAIPHVAIQVPDDEIYRQYVGKWDDPPYDGKKGYLPHPSPRAGYAAMISRMDRDVGRILDLLEELSLDRKTLVVFTSDNGPTHDGCGGSDSDFFESAGPLRGRKGSVLEGGLRVPFIARWPGTIEPNTTTDHVSAFWGRSADAGRAGRGRNAGERRRTEPGADAHRSADQQKRHECLVWEFYGYGGQVAVRQGDWKLVRQEINRDPNRPPALYNLADDVHEDHDVSADHPDVVARLQSLYQREHVDSPLFQFKKRSKK